MAAGRSFANVGFRPEAEVQKMKLKVCFVAVAVVREAGAYACNRWHKGPSCPGQRHTYLSMSDAAINSILARVPNQRWPLSRAFHCRRRVSLRRICSEVGEVRPDLWVVDGEMCRRTPVQKTQSRH